MLGSGTDAAITIDPAAQAFDLIAARVTLDTRAQRWHDGNEIQVKRQRASLVARSMSTCNERFGGQS
ncbi:hypothetical protein AF72_11700 [Xylella taiwanensis]|uniref:Uncharacterized protein n=1 Tax=Xylella taiwanensis TaxID=1444770 RepID=Z9JGY7_9GAMM|nr:hypothetical protein AB672_06165 [Xylella taiwanensis]EWS77293.1 hypothetical protein AF72_11700 [Xylella taiwanensis]